MPGFDFLDNPLVWEVSRTGLDMVFGLYRKRFAALGQLGVNLSGMSVLDIGCGIGTYSKLADGPYLGVDLNERYIDYARKRNREKNKSFRCADVKDLLKEETRYDLVLMVDFLHHIPEDICKDLLRTSSRLARKWVVVFDAVKQQSNALGQWIIDNDRGDYMRTEPAFYALFEGVGLNVSQRMTLQVGPLSTRVMLSSPQPG